MSQAEKDTDDANVDPPVSLSQIKLFPIEAPILFLVCMFFYIGVLNFYQVASKIMQETGSKYSNDTASLFLSIPNFVSILASPLFGGVVDVRGRALYFIALASLMLGGAHVLFLGLANDWFFIHPTIIMVWIGFAYSLGAACIWPILAFVIEKNMLATAYGCMTAIQNFGSAFISLGIGQIQDHTSAPLKYNMPILIFLGSIGTAFALTILLIILDKRHGGKLNQSGIERANAQKALKDEKDFQATQASHAKALDDAIFSQSRQPLNGTINVRSDHNIQVRS